MTLNHSGVMEIILHFHNYYFMNEPRCPVPREQQPTNEFMELSKSIFFSWPKTKNSLILILIKFWLGAFVLFLIISSGSVYFKSSLLKYFLLSFFSSLSIPLLITIRLYLGWNHVFKRLISEKVEYEESGWYDGQIWQKPLVLKEKESLIASLEVKPILKNLIQISSIILVLALLGILLFQYNNF
ncbi:putative membrane protein Ycf36 [Prochlorococcus sp. MIT 0604]|nr:putative membrane protein Ycf36 [Prochlorococcus sp. MIT 0604]